MNILESHVDAGQALPAKDRREYYTAVVEYLAYGREPKISGAAAAVFIAIRPSLDNARARAEAGRAGGSKRPGEAQANAKQAPGKTASSARCDAEAADGQAECVGAIEPQANAKQSASKPEANAKLLGIGRYKEKRTPKGVPKEKADGEQAKPRPASEPWAGEVSGRAPSDAFARYA